MKTDTVWRIGRLTIQPFVKFIAPLSVYGRDRVPLEGGLVIASNHFSWIDPPALGAATPRTVYFVAKVEAHRVPGLGQLMRSFGALSVRRGESDREAVRLMRQVVRDGNALGMFAEGSRQRSGVPGHVQPGSAMVAITEGVPLIPVAIHGSQQWRLGNFAPVSLAWGVPMTFDGIAHGGRGYKEASLEVERKLQELWRWLGDVHAQGRPRDAVPPR